MVLGVALRPQDFHSSIRTRGCPHAAQAGAKFCAQCGATAWTEKETDVEFEGGKTKFKQFCHTTDDFEYATKRPLEVVGLALPWPIDPAQLSALLADPGLETRLRQALKDSGLPAGGPLKLYLVKDLSY